MIGNDLKDANIRQNNVKGNHHMCMCVVLCWGFFLGGGEGIRKDLVYGGFNKSGFSNIRKTPVH